VQFTFAAYVMVVGEPVSFEVCAIARTILYPSPDAGMSIPAPLVSSVAVPDVDGEPLDCAGGCRHSVGAASDSEGEEGN